MSTPQLPAILLSEHGAKIIKDMTLEEFTDALQYMKTAHEYFHNNLSTIIRYGNKKFGEKVVKDQLEQLEFGHNDANKAIALSSLPEDFKAKHKLSSEHNFVLSKITSDQEREKWASIANEHTLSPLDLKKSIRKGEVITQEQIEKKLGSNSSIMTIEGVMFYYLQWAKKQGGTKKILSLPNDTLELLLDQIRPICELAITISEKIDDLAEHSETE